MGAGLEEGLTIRSSGLLCRRAQLLPCMDVSQVPHNHLLTPYLDLMPSSDLCGYFVHVHECTHVRAHMHTRGVVGEIKIIK